MSAKNKTQIPAQVRARGSAPSASASTATVNPRPALAHRNLPLCRTSAYKPPGSNTVGLSKDNQPSKVVWELDYGLNEQQFKSLSSRFPGVAFVQTGFGCHDHPIAHTSYRIVWEQVQRKLQPGWRVADISGNPTHNERFNKAQAKRNNPIQIDSFCKVVTPKDSIRAKMRWGPQVANGVRRWEEMTVYDMYRNEENRARFAKYDCFLMNHALYYFTKSEICQLLNLNPDAVLIATLHKLPGQNGDINCGEQHYEKDFLSGQVVQTNVETGEYYKHPDPAPWFRHFAYADEHGAIAWTINKGCDDTYILTATSTNPGIVSEDCWLDGKIIFRHEGEVVQVTMPVDAVPPPAYPVEEVTFTTRDLLPSSATSKQTSIRITHPELYDKLRAFMINKPRTHRTLSDLTAKAHREVGNNTLIGGEKKVKISPEALTAHIFAAWMAGVGFEAEMFSAAVRSSYSDAVNRNLTGKTLNVGGANMAKQLARFALTASTIARSKEPVHAVLNHIDELL